MTLPLGKTFTDKAAGVHVTPLSRENTFPGSMEVAVNFTAANAANRPPSGVLTAHQGQVPNTSICSFSVAAADPDNDSMAYYWALEMSA